MKLYLDFSSIWLIRGLEAGQEKCIVTVLLLVCPCNRSIIQGILWHQRVALFLLVDLPSAGRLLSAASSTLRLVLRKRFL